MIADEIFFAFSSAFSHVQQSMKMIASTKLNKAQRAMAAAKAYGAANTGMYPSLNNQPAIIVVRRRSTLGQERKRWSFQRYC